MRASKRVSRKNKHQVKSVSGRTGLSLERMEDRLLLAVDVFVQDGTLTVQGDRGDNSVEIDRPSREKIAVMADGKEIAFEFAELKNIKIDLGPGDDRLRLAPELVPQNADEQAPRLEIDLGEGDNRVSVGEEQKPPVRLNLERVARAAEASLSSLDNFLQTNAEYRGQRSKAYEQLQSARDRAEREFLIPARELAEKIKEEGDPRVEELQSLLSSADEAVSGVLQEFQAIRVQREAAVTNPLVGSFSSLRDFVAAIDSELEAEENDPAGEPGVEPRGNAAPGLQARMAAPTCSDFVDGNVVFSIVFIGGSGNDFISIAPSVTANALLIGNGGFDTLLGGGGHDRIEGGDDDDILRGGPGNDYMLGDAGNDEMRGEFGNDCMYGGDGADFLYGGRGDDNMEGNLGDDFLFGNGGNDLMLGQEGVDCVHGGTGDDRGIGGPDRDFVWGGPDNDYLEGNGGIDVVMGEDGADRMLGGSDSDAMLGGNGIDVISGGGDFDLILGEGDIDYIIGNAGDDEINGGAGDDVIFGNNGDDEIQGGAGADTIFSGNGADSVQGQLGNDYIVGGNGVDLLDGNGGDDSILGGDQRDFIYGRAGHDCLEGNGGEDTIDAGIGNDIVHGNGSNDLIFGRLGDDSITGGDDQDIALGADGDDVMLTGDDSIDLLWGAIGDDTYEGTAGTNIIFDPHVGETNLLYSAAGINLEVFPSTITAVAGFYPSTIPSCSAALADTSGTDFAFDARMFASVFEGALLKSTIGFDGLSGVMVGDEYSASHGVTFENLGAFGAQSEGNPANVESLDGYDGGVYPDGDTVYLSHPNHVDPFTMHFSPAVSSVGSFLATGIQGSPQTVTIEAFDGDGNLIQAITIDTNEYNDPQNREAFWAIEAGEDSIARVTILNNNPNDFGNALIVDNIMFTRSALGDFNLDGELDADDLDQLCTAIGDGDTNPIFDVNGDGSVNHDDHTYWVKQIKETWFGDANLDGEFGSADLVDVFQAAKYETGLAAGWAEGDWNCDGVFDSGDLVTAFQDGGYEQGPLPAIAMVANRTTPDLDMFSQPIVANVDQQDSGSNESPQPVERPADLTRPVVTYKLVDTDRIFANGEFDGIEFDTEDLI
ncbi:hypothetical protein ACFL2H_05025 [Planctomycetota bacterium]